MWQHMYTSCTVTWPVMWRTRSSTKPERLAIVELKRSKKEGLKCGYYSIKLGVYAPLCVDYSDGRIWRRRAVHVWRISLSLSDLGGYLPHLPHQSPSPSLLLVLPTTLRRWTRSSPWTGGTWWVSKLCSDLRGLTWLVLCGFSPTLHRSHAPVHSY